jgi:hypothetical protein
VVWSNVLSGINADLRAVWAKNGYEQNLVIKSRPPSPETFGFSSATTRLQLWTAMDACPVPQRQRPFVLKTGLVDHILEFSDSLFPVGSAFAFGTVPIPPAGEATQVRQMDPSAPDTTPVAKSLVDIDGLTVLVEEVNYTDLAPMLNALPETAMTQPAHPSSVEMAARGRLLPKGSAPSPHHAPMHVASSQYVPTGVTLDYLTLTGGATSWIFTNTTYYISNYFYVSSWAAFSNNACIKLNNNAYFELLQASVTFPSSGSKVVFTSKDDNAYGTRIDGSTSEPGYTANRAIWVYAPITSITVQNVLIRWANKGIHYNETYGAFLYPTLRSAAFENCATGVYLDIGNDTLSLSSDTYCNVVTPTNIITGSISGSITADCGTPTTNWLGDVSKLPYMEGEPSVAINPTSPENLYVASNRVFGQAPGVYGTYTNAGAGWSTDTLLTNSYCDPTVAFDAYGNLFVCYLLNGDSVVVLLSTDKGNSFVTNTTFTGLLDYPRLATGPGVVWLTAYDTIGSNSFVSGAAVTGLGSVGSWTNTAAIRNTLPNAGNYYGYGYGDIAVGRTGQVAVVVVDAGASTNGPTEMRVSVNSSGLTTNFSAASAFITNHVGMHEPIPAQPSRGIYPTPSLAWDRTGGPFKDRIYMAYTDRVDTNSANTDIYVIYSNNNGTNWSNPLKINTDTTATSQFFPHIAVDQSSGKVAASWYDCRADTNNVKTQFYAAVSSDGGVTFSSNNLLLAPGQSDVTLPEDNGWVCDYCDYTGLAFYGGYFYPAWADNSNATGGNPDSNNGTGGMDIYVGRVRY